MLKYYFIGLFLFYQIEASICQSFDIDQSIVVRFDNKRNDKVIRELLERYYKSYSYNADLITKKKVTIQSDSLSIRQLIKYLFEDSTLIVNAIHNQIIIYKPVRQQSLHCVGQRIIQGKVFHSVTNEPIPYAPIRYANGTKFTVTNASGDFVINIPCDQNLIPIEIHALGYQTKRDTLNIHSPSIVMIQPTAKTLREVIIRSVSPELALSKSLNSISNNYTNERTIANSFFREIIFKDENLVAISESILDIYKGGYGKGKLDKVKLKKGRKLLALNYNDTINFKLKGSLSSCLRLDIVNNLPKFYSKEGLDKYDYVYVDLIEYGDNLVHQVDFQPKKNNNEDFYKGSLYFDDENLALRTVSFGVPPKLMNLAINSLITRKPKQFNMKPKSVNYLIHYRNNGEKLYLSYVQIQLKIRIIDKRTHSNNTFTSQAELVINSMIPSEEKLPHSESFLTNQILLEQTVEYDMSFWKDIDFLPVDINLYDAIKQLE